MTDKTYEQLAAENWPTERLPVDEGERCPPFRATLFRLAEAISQKSPLTPELQELQEHLDECGACRSTVSESVSLLNAKSTATAREVVQHVLWEETPLRRIMDCAGELMLVRAQPARKIFNTLCKQAGLTEAEGFDAVGLFHDEAENLHGEAGVWLLRDLGVPENMISFVEKTEVSRKRSEPPDSKKPEKTIVLLATPAKPSGPPPEPE